MHKYSFKPFLGYLELCKRYKKQWQLHPTKLESSKKSNKLQWHTVKSMVSSASLNYLSILTAVNYVDFA